MKKLSFLFHRRFLPIWLTGFLITITGIVFHQSPVRMLPLYVSLVIGFLQSRVNRYASLLGGCNAILYAIVYGYYGLYASMAYAALVSCPLQILTFLRWTKHARESTTELRVMTARQRILTAIAFFTSWIALYAVLSFTDSTYQLFDSSITLFGILITVLTYFACIEYTVLMIPSGLLSIGLYAAMLRESPEQVPYLIYSIYSFVCVCVSVRQAQRIYRAQTEEKKNISAQKG